MKKLTLIISALALVLGLSQCRKPENPGCGLCGGEGQLKTIEFTVNDNGGAKGDLVYANQKLRYQWDNDDSDNIKDSLCVYYATQQNFSDGVYVGRIPVTEVTVENYSHIAKFEGDLPLPTTAGYLRFIHFGQGITAHSGSASVDFSLQNGDISSVSSKIVAVAEDQLYNGTQTSFTAGAMPVKFAIMKLDLSKFDADNVLLNGDAIHNVINVSSTGVINYSGTGTVLGNVTSNQSAYYAVVPTGLTSATSTSMTFEGNDKTATGTKEIKDNGYYHGTDGNASIVVNATSSGGSSSNGAGSASPFDGGNW